MTRKIAAAEAESVGPQGSVSAALASQQAQTAGKARVDLGAVAAAVEAGGQAQPDGTTYPGGVQKRKAAATDASAAGTAQPGPPQGSTAHQGVVPGALASQQASASGKARVDLGAMAAAVQGTMTLAAPLSPRAKADEVAQIAVGSDATLTGAALAKGTGSRAGSSARPLFEGYLAGVVRTASSPLPAVPPPISPATGIGVEARHPTDTPSSAERADRLPSDGGRSPPDTVAPLSLQGSPIANPAAHAPVQPAGASAAAAAASLGIPAGVRTSSRGGDRMLLETAAARQPSSVGQILVSRDHAAAMADDLRGTAEADSRRARVLAAEVGRLRLEAASRREEGAVASADMLESRARGLQLTADRLALAAGRASAAGQEWSQRARDLHLLESEPSASRERVAGGLEREAGLAEARLLPARRERRMVTSRRCVRPDGGPS